jgi:TPR repeat protein
MHANAWGVEENLPYALRLAKGACDQKVPLGCGLLASFYAMNLSGPEHFPEVVPLLTLGCDGDDPLSCESLGGQRIDPRFGPVNITDALEYFLKACRLGHKRACMKAAAAMNDGGSRNAQRVLDLYSESCDAGYAAACFLLGKNSTTQGTGAERSREAFARACRWGIREACANVSGVPSN